MQRAILYMRADPKGPYEHRDHLALQMSYLVDYCKKNNIEVAAYCEDRCDGIGFKERMGLMRLLFDVDSKKLKADLLLFTSYDVLATKMIDIWRMTSLLADYGIEAKNIYDEEGFKVVTPNIKKDG